MLVGYFTDNLFQQVLERDDAFNASVLVDHESEMRLGFLHLPQHVLQTRRVHDIHWRLQNLVESEFFRPQEKLGHVFAVNEADHIIGRFAIHGQA